MKPLAKALPPAPTMLNLKRGDKVMRIADVLRKGRRSVKGLVLGIRIMDGIRKVLVIWRPNNNPTTVSQGRSWIPANQLQIA